MSNTIKKQNLIFSIFLINIFFFTVFISVIKQFLGNYLGWNTTYSVFPLAVAFSAYGYFKISGENVGEKIQNLFFLFILLIVLIYLSSAAELFSAWDGIAYHKPAMYLQYVFGNIIFSKKEIMPFWSFVYPKATWIFSGEISAFLGKFSALTLYSLLTSAAIFFYSRYFCEKLGVKNRVGILFSFLIVFNPIFISQNFSTYVDSTLAALAIIIFFATALLCEKNDRYSWYSWYLLVVACSLIVNVKFSGFLIVAISFLSLGLNYIKKYQELKLVFAMFFVFVVLGVCIIGFNPYLINIVEGRHIFHPLFGEGRIDIMSEMTPKFILNGGRLEKLFYSIFSLPQLGIPEFSYLKSPLGIELNFFKDTASTVDQRIGGFGPVFPLMVVLGFFSYFFVKFWKLPKIILLLIWMCFLSILLNPESWWARYNIAVYLIFLIPILVKCENGFFKILKTFLILAAISQTLLLLFYSIVNAFEVNRYVDLNFNKMKGDTVFVKKSDNYGAGFHFFERYGIKTISFDENKFFCNQPETVAYGYLDVGYCRVDDGLKKNVQGELSLYVPAYPRKPIVAGISLDGVGRGINFLRIKKSNEIDAILSFDTYSGDSVDVEKVREFIESKKDGGRIYAIGWDSLVPDKLDSPKNFEISTEIGKILEIKSFPLLKFRQAFVIDLNKSKREIYLGDPEEILEVNLID